MKLDYKQLAETIYYNVPDKEIGLICKSFPQEMVLRLVGLLAEQLEKKQKVEVNIRWIRGILQTHGEFFRNNLQVSLPYLRLLHNILSLYDEQFRKLVEDNSYQLAFYCNMCEKNAKKASEKTAEKMVE